MHFRLADRAYGGQLGDLRSMLGDIRHPAIWRPRRATLEAEELAKTAHLLPRPLPLRQERLERGAVDQQRPAVVDRLQSFPQPLPDRIAVNAEELRDLRDIVANAGLDPVERVAAPLTRSLFGLRIGVSGVAVRGDAIGNPAVNLVFDPGDAARRNRDGRRKATVADVRIDRTAAHAGSRKNLLQTN